MTWVLGLCCGVLAALAGGLALHLARERKRYSERQDRLGELEAALANLVRELERTRAQEAQRAKELARYLPTDVAQRITNAPADGVGIKRRRGRLTVCFVDIVGFTSMADSLAPEDLEALLNRYFTVMTEIVQSRGGTLDKFMGDGIMVFFAGEGADAEAASACVRMAIDMQVASRRLADEWQGRGSEVPLRIRIGIATGYCSVGNFGSHSRVQYTAVGGPVNLAARLEAAAEPGGILLAHSTFGLVRDAFVLEPAGTLSLKGLARPIHAYLALRECTPGEARAVLAAAGMEG